MDENMLLAQLLFPNDLTAPAEYETIYPPRTLPKGACVTRFAPSPTGFLHIGSLYPPFLDQWLAKTSGGVFYLRIEDTDAKREIQDGDAEIVRGLADFAIVPDEGPQPDGEECGAYGPYSQRARRKIYHSFAKKLVEQGLAYPCFCTAEDLDALRTGQEEKNVNKGYYGSWASCRCLSFAQQKAALAAGKPYVLRLRCAGMQQPEKKIVVEDLIRGKLELPANGMDAVLLKTDGIPTYHFAHAVDDHLMRTTHVIRGDEWIASLPLHIELFCVLGFKPPKYAHIAPLMKAEDGGKRKISKRKDPEAAVSALTREGYPVQAVREYLATVANSNYEQWRKENPAAALESFPLNFKKMSASGALYDPVKLADVSKQVISLLDADTVLSQVLVWAEGNHPQLFKLLQNDRAYAKALFAIDRDVPKPRKDIAKWSDVPDYAAYFYDETFKPAYDFPESINAEDAQAITAAYAQVYDENDTREVWFDKIKALCEPLGFSPDVKAYKQNPAQFKGHVGDVSAVIRLALTARRNTPDLYSIARLLGRERVMRRLQTKSS